ncbi:MAG: NAD(P)/FAD-dependent oxidoreductase [Acidimicrobiales bacterium]
MGAERSGAGAARVVVVGAGFAGLAVADGLAGGPVAVTLVDRHVYTTFQPLLYQVATAGLNPGDVAFSTRAFVRSRRAVDFRQGELVGMDPVARQVTLDDGSVLPYDCLVLAFGATTSYFGVRGAAERSMAIYTLDDAIGVRERSVALLERASAHGAGSGELRVVIVGGGATGVEMAGTLAELGAVTLARDYPHVDPSLAEVVLVEQQDRLLGGFHERLGAYALEALRRRGVRVRLGETVAEVMDHKVRLSSGEELRSGMVVWAAGVAVGDVAGKLGLPQERGGRISVEQDLSVKGHPEVFAVGDVAAARDRHGHTLAQLAQPAIQAGAHAARQILALQAGRRTEPFRYREKGAMATIGRRAAVAQLPAGIHLTGTVAWLAWLALHLVTLLGVRNRLAVLTSWAWRYLSWHRGPRIILGG